MRQNMLALLVILLSVSISIEKSVIECNYDVTQNSDYTPLLGDRFTPDSPIKMTINGVEENSSSKYLFSRIGTYYIHFELSGDINMDFMFEDVVALERVYMYSDEHYKITRFESTFAGCESLMSFQMNGFDTSSATSMKKMFYKTSRLDSADFSQFNTDSVLDMSSMFESSYIFTLDLRNFNTRRVRNMNSMFKYCQNLLFLNVETFDTSSVTDMSNMFLWDDSLLRVDLRK